MIKVDVNFGVIRCSVLQLGGWNLVEISGTVCRLGNLKYIWWQIAFNPVCRVRMCSCDKEFWLALKGAGIMHSFEVKFNSVGEVLGHSH